MPPTRTDAEPAAGPLLSPTRVGDVNRSRVLQTLVDHGPLSRADLAKFANVTRATIGNIAQSLLDTGILEECEPRSGHVGKPARPLWFAPRAVLSLVLSFDEAQCQVALADARGEIWAHHVLPYPSLEPSRQELERLIGKALEAVRPHAGEREIVGVGVSVPALCDPGAGEVIGTSVIPDLVGTWLRNLLAERVGVPVIIDNDSRAQALAEKWFGLGRGVPTFASVQTGRSVGVGVVLDGAIFRAERGLGAEFGHTIVDVDGERCRCGSTGCWETIAGTDWISREARRRSMRRAGALDLAELAARSVNDSKAADLLRRYADNLAVGLTNLMHVYHPMRFILHGDAVRGGERMREAIEAALRERVFERLRDDVDVVLSELDQRATLLGAAALVLSDRYDLRV